MRVIDGCGETGGCGCGCGCGARSLRVRATTGATPPGAYGCEHNTCESFFHPECFVCMCAGGFMQLQCFHARTVHKCVCLCLTHRQGPAAWPGILRFGESYGCVRVRRPLPPAPACGCGCVAPTYGCVRVRVQAHFPPPAPACGCGALTYGCVRVRVTTGAGDQRVRRPARTRIHP